MSRRRRSSMSYSAQKNIEGSSQLEIDRIDQQTIVPIKPKKKKKPSRRGSRGRGLSKKDKKDIDSAKELPTNKNSSSQKNRHDKTDPAEERISHYADRIEFIIASKYDNGRFIGMIGDPTTIFRDASKNCPPNYCVYTSDGIKVYPLPTPWLGVDKYSIQNLDTHETEAIKYSELNEAIKHCRIGYGVFDPKNDRVY